MKGETTIGTMIYTFSINLPHELSFSFAHLQTNDRMKLNAKAISPRKIHVVE